MFELTPVQLGAAMTEENDADLTRAVDTYTASWHVGFAAARARLDWRTGLFTSTDAAIGFVDGALAYERERGQSEKP